MFPLRNPQRRPGPRSFICGLQRCATVITLKLDIMSSRDMHLEFKLAYLSVLVLAIGIISTQLIRDDFSMGIVGTGLLSIGGFLIAFGFWGSDYAFSVAIGELDQSKQEGKVRGQRGKVHVPFMRNYTPTEWWNLNWFLTTVGVFCLVFGAYFVGLLLGRLGV